MPLLRIGKIASPHPLDEVDLHCLTTHVSLLTTF